MRVPVWTGVRDHTGRSLLCTSTGQISKRHSGQGEVLFLTDSDRGCNVVRRRSWGLFLSCALPCSAARRMRYTAEQGITNTSQVICSGDTSAYLPCPGAVAIASVPPPVRPQEMGKGVKVSPHWLLDLGWRQKKTDPVHSTRCPIVVQTYNGSQGLPMCQAASRRKNTGLLLVIGRYTPITTVTSGTAQIERFFCPMGLPSPPTISYRSRLPGSLGAK